MSPRPLPDKAGRPQSPGDLARQVNRRVAEYLEAGFKLLWLVDADVRIVYIYRLDGSTSLLREEDELIGESALRTFRCRVGDLFT